MLSANQKKLFDSCVEAMVHVQSRGVDRAHKEQIDTVTRTSDLLYHLAHDITSTRPLAKRHVWVRDILQKINPDTQYDVPELVARDLLDICITLSRLLNDKSRKIDPSMKVVNAQAFCDYAAHGLD